MAVESGTTSLPPAAVQRLVESHRQFLSFLERRVESKETAEDILQAAFVRGLERGGDIQDEESAVAWFYRVLRNAVIDHYRHRASKERAHQTWESEFARSETPPPELHQDICQCVSALMETLKPEYRDALRMVDLEDRSLADLAQQTGITPGNAAVRIHRARAALHKQVTIACGTCAEHGCLDCHCSPKAGGHGCAS